jgi:glycosyltransferase domain-containing protein
MATSEYVILIPTGRHFYLNRLVDYYDYCGELSRVMVLDCSKTPWERSHSKEFTYHHLPGLSFMARLKFALDNTQAQYFSMCADDDFFIPDGIKSCVRFLDDHKDYSAAFGRYVRFSIKDTILYSEQYPREHHRDLSQEAPAARLLDMIDCYIQLFYAVHTRRVFQQITEIEEMYDDTHFMNACGERIFTILPPLMGKVKSINEACVLREQENHKSSRQLSYYSMAKAWVVCNEVMLRMMGEFGADTPFTRETLAFFVEKWLYAHFSSEIESRGEPRLLPKSPGMDDWLDRDTDNLAYITYRGKKFIPSDFSHIPAMGFDNQGASEEAIHVVDQFLKRFVRDYVRCKMESKKAT